MVVLSDKIQKKGVKSTLDLAREFLDKQVTKKEFVIDHTKIPNKRVKDFLRVNDYLYSPCKYMYIIKDNKTPNNVVLEHNYFNLVSQLSKGSVVGGEIALNHHVGKTSKVRNIDIITPTKNGEVNLGNNDNYVVRYQKSEIYRDIEKVTINNAKLFIETPTSYLINNFNYDNLENEDFNVLLNTTNFMLGDIKKFIEKGSSVTSLSRMALRYKDNENPRNYSLIKTALQQSGKQLNNPINNLYGGDTEEVGNLFNTSLEYNTDPVPDKNPKIERFGNFVDKLDKQCSEYLEQVDLSFIKLRSLEQLLENIDHNIVHDSYHSLTIENYKVSREDIELLKDPDHHEKEVEDIENKLIIKGYLNSYKTVVEQIKVDYSYGTKISKSFITDINEKLFKNIAEAKGFASNDKYRIHNVEITGTSHMPTDPELIEDQMDILIDYVNLIDTTSNVNRIKKAVMTHFLFVYIHPFGDGNGRTGRFLMNHTLGSNKLDWITILSENKKEYISALKKGSEDGDITEFTKVITEYLRKTD